MADLPIAPFKRIVKNVGGGRVSEDAAKELRDEIESVSCDIATRAAQLAEHAGRKTVTAEDVRLAAKT